MERRRCQTMDKDVKSALAFVSFKPFLHEHIRVSPSQITVETLIFMHDFDFSFSILYLLRSLARCAQNAVRALHETPEIESVGRHHQTLLPTPGHVHRISRALRPNRRIHEELRKLVRRAERCQTASAHSSRSTAAANNKNDRSPNAASSDGKNENPVHMDHVVNDNNHAATCTNSADVADIATDG